MLIRRVVPAVVATVSFVVREVVASTGRASELSGLTRRFKLGDVVTNVKGHEEGVDGAVVAGKRDAAMIVEVLSIP